MARLRLLLFALVALGLFAGLEYLKAPTEQARAEHAAHLHAHAAGRAALAAVSQRQDALAGFAFAASQSAELAGAIPATSAGRAREPGAESFDAVRKAIAALTPELFKGKVAILWTGKDQTLAALGEAAPKPSIDGLDLSKVVPGEVTQVLGSEGPYVATAFVPTGRQNVTVTLAVPAVEPSGLNALATAQGVSAIAILQQGKLLAAGGPLVGQFQKALTQAKDGVVARGPSGKLFGKVALPLFTSAGLTGEKAPLSLLATTSDGGFEAAAVASLSADLAVLASAQTRAVESVIGLFVLFLVLLAIPGGKKTAGKAMAIDEQLTRKSQSAGNPTDSLTVKASTSQQLALAEAPPPEASPDDFNFGPALQGTPLPPEPAPAPPAEDAFAMFGSAPAPAAASPLFEAPPAYAAGYEDEEPPEEATRVAAIPAELLQQAAHKSDEFRIPAAAPAPMPSVPPEIDGDELHFQEVFREFVATRELCGEAADGLTYEKFVLKLRKNRESLIEKYNCRTVRFQVYVKENKAALKATPVKT